MPNVEYTKEDIRKAKDWFGQGEADVDLMIAAGVITLQAVLAAYTREKDNQT